MKQQVKQMDRVTHFELPVDDVDRAEQFYLGVFGWQIVAQRVRGPGYDLVNTVQTDQQGNPIQVGAINGGIQERAPAAECPILVITVKSVADSLKR